MVVDIMGDISMIFFLNLDMWFRRRCRFILHFLSKAWRPFSAQRNHLCMAGRGHYKKHFCEIILNLDQWFRYRLMIFLI